ncbi:MAG: lycopene beta-cyclase CrtY [Wenzhouxiangellaceae bacterium]|nr:lycopene beta-cyclase CrtY [Wenzhouxiangellaceae bacterium]
MQPNRPELILAGGGLANCLIAWRVAQRHPETAIVILEAGPSLGGNHTWSFHAGDLSDEQLRDLAPLIAHRWPRQRVRFPKLDRVLEMPYYSIRSESLQPFIEGFGNIEIRNRCRVTALGRNSADLLAEAADSSESRQSLHGSAVIDGRGPGQNDGMALGFQKFVGREVRTVQPHGLAEPVIMDASVSQCDGYRFVYLLPFSADTLLIEDTRYSDGEALDDRALRESIDEYARARGWQIAETLREEQGVLPILLAADLDRFWPPSEAAPARAGLSAGLFHPTTGYSLPQAFALADAIAAHWPLDGDQLAQLTREFTRRFWHRTRFFRLLNRMLFRAGRPDQRYRVLERFYRLSAPLITNFYAADLKLHQQARIISGKPPVPIGQALPLMSERKFLDREFRD